MNHLVQLCRLNLSRIFLAFSIVGFILFGSVCAIAEPLPPSKESEAIHQQLRQLKTDMQDALNNMDVDKKLSRITDDAVFTTMNGDRVVGKENIRQYFQKMLKSEHPIVKKVHVDFKVDELAHLYGDNVAVAFGTSNDIYQLSDGFDFKVTPRWSATMVRTGDDWKVASFHYSTNMFDNPVLDYQKKIHLLVGSILMFLAVGIGYLLGKRASQK